MKGFRGKLSLDVIEKLFLLKMVVQEHQRTFQNYKCSLYSFNINALRNQQILVYMVLRKA